MTGGGKCFIGKAIQRQAWIAGRLVHQVVSGLDWDFGQNDLSRRGKTSIIRQADSAISHFLCNENSNVKTAKVK